MREKAFSRSVLRLLRQRGVQGAFPKKGKVSIMHKSEENMIKGVAMGVLAGTAAGSLGAYVAQKNPKEIKKTMQKVAKTAEKAIVNAEKMMHY